MAEIRISLTEGNLKNNSLRIGVQQMGFFPNDAFGPANSKNGTGTALTLHRDGFPDPVSTDIDGAKRIFRNRGPWRAYFEHHHLRAGDQVIIERLSLYEYRLTSLPRGES